MQGINFVVFAFLVLCYLVFAVIYFFVDHQLPFFLPPKTEEDGRLIMMTEPMIWMEIQIMMLPMGMIYVFILKL